jgi:DNA-binding transcriptional LysR family regulator
MLSQRALEAFLAVMSTGSISAGASELAISQPAVSRHVRDLEAATGLRLFDRIGNRVSPTEAAHALADEVERAFVGLAEIETAAREIRRGRREHLRIAAMPVLSMTLLADVVADVQAAGNLPDLEILSASTQNVVRLVARRQAVLGFVAPLLEMPEIRLLAHERVPLRCIMRAGDPLAGKTLIDPEDLADRSIISYSSTTATGAALEQVYARMRQPPRIIVRARLSPVISALALRGVGIGIVDAFTARDHVIRGGVSRPIDIPETFGFSVITTRIGATHPAAEIFLERVRARVADFARDGCRTQNTGDARETLHAP